MKTVEQKFRSEAGAVKAQRRAVQQGYTTSLIGFDPARNLYVFDVYIPKEN